MLSLFAATLAFGANTADNSKQAVQTVKQSKDAKKKPAKKQREWAKFDRYESANARIKKAPAAVFMGDSITANWYSFRPEFFAENNYAGRGISGQTSSEMLVRFRNDVINLKPKYVAIMAGTNDVAENNGKIKLENVLSNIISMAELGRLHGIKVVLCSVLPASKIPWRKSITEPAQKIAKLNSLIKDYAEKNGFAYVDYYSALVDENGGLPEKYSKDGVHPNKETYPIMEALIKAEFAK